MEAIRLSRIELNEIKQEIRKVTKQFIEAGEDSGTELSNYDRN